jgi:hypothetical protein
MTVHRSFIERNTSNHTYRTGLDSVGPWPFVKVPVVVGKRLRASRKMKSPKDSPQTVTRPLYFNSHIEDWTATVLLGVLDKSLPKRSVATRSGHIHHCPSLLGSNDTGEVVLPKTGSNCKAITTDHHLQSQFITSA